MMPEMKKSRVRLSASPQEMIINSEMERMSKVSRLIYIFFSNQIILIKEIDVHFSKKKDSNIFFKSLN